MRDERLADDVNLRAMWRSCRATVPVLRAQERSSIVNVSSLAAIADARAAMVLLGRQGSGWDVANATLVLASNEAAFITGVCLLVDGGMCAGVG